MPRTPRGDSAERIYHIINRGNMSLQVFDDQDFLELLKKDSEKEAVSIHTRGKRGQAELNLRHFYPTLTLYIN